MFFRSIKSRLTAFVFVMVLLPLLLLGFMMFRASSSVIEENVTLNTTELMDQLLDNIEFRLSDMEDVARNIAFNNTINNSLAALKGSYDDQEIDTINEINLALNKEISTRDGIKSVFLMGDHFFINRNGNTYLSPPIHFVPESMRQEAWYKEAIAKGGKSFFTIAPSSGSARDSMLGEMRQPLRMARLLRDIRSGNPIGVLGVDMDSAFIDRLVSKLHDKYDDSLILIDEKGDTIYKEDAGDRFSSFATFGDMTRESGVEHATVDGQMMLKIYRTSRLSGWKIIQLIPLNELLSPIEVIKKWTLVWAAIGLLAAMIMSVFVSNLLFKPLKHLISLMKKVQRGDLDAKIERIRDDEIGHLSKSFNAMTERLKVMRNEMYREQELKRTAELSALLAQIQPHFLYNTLDSIKWMAVIRGENQISEMISALSNLLRNSINLGKEMITVRQEVDNLKHYIHIQQMRYIHVFSMEVNVEEEAWDYEIPKLILQPLVENALFHGLESMEGGGRIVLSISLHSDLLVCKVADNGKGMAPETIEKVMEGRIQTRFSGISVKNVNDRLRLHYGLLCGLQFESIEGKGTEVTIRIPATMDSGRDSIA